MNSAATFTPPAAEPGQASVYIYRPSAMSNALYSPGLNIDGEFRLYTRNGVSSRIALLPGKHVFEFQAEESYSDLSPVTLTLEAGKIYFIRVTTSLKIKSITADYQPYTRSFKLTPVAEQLAVKEIAECCLDNRSRTADKTETGSTEKGNGDSFSIDKTQNPFSR
jgi:hypothetical protein